VKKRKELFVQQPVKQVASKAGMMQVSLRFYRAGVLETRFTNPPGSWMGMSSITIGPQLKFNVYSG